VTVALVQASEALREVAEPERGKRALLKLSRVLTWSYRHTKAVYYCERGTVVDADEMEEVKKLKRKADERKARIAKEEQEASNEVAELRARLARLESILLAQDEAFHSENLAALRVQADRLGRTNND